ncbi:MAG: metalloregulator ArsR/SmtB family transcription factor [archaeon]
MGIKMNEKTIKILKALANETRLKIVEFLLNGEKCVCEIFPYVKRTQSTTSIQLSKLESAGIVEAKRKGKQVFYMIKDYRVCDIFKALGYTKGKILKNSSCIGGNVGIEIKTDKWKGIDREEINWHPTIDESKCMGCGMCVTSCGRNVFDYDTNKKKAIVARPNNCMVGCTSCEVWCIFNAISFPDKRYVKDLIKKRGVLKIVRKELEDKLKNKSCSGGSK